MAEREAAAAARNRAPCDEDRGNNDAAGVDTNALGTSSASSPPPSPPPCSSSAVVPRSTRDYSRIEYWDKRFETEEEYEWCGRYEDFRSLLVAALKGGGGGSDGGDDGDGDKGDARPPPPSPPRAARRVLVLGSGTSRLPFDLAAERALLLPELEEVVATDLSAVAVGKMAARTRLREEEAERGGDGEMGDGDGDDDDGATAKKQKGKGKSKARARITWQVADMLSLPFPDASFDAVIDKGVLDALFAGFGGTEEGSKKQRYDKWRPRETAPDLWDLAQRALRESHRVLDPEGGRYVQVSFEQPHFRRPFLDAPGLSWRGKETAFGEQGGLQFFFYLRRRGNGGDEGEEAAASSEIPSGYKPDESPMHDHMDEEDFLLRTSL